jgi:MFS family permease
MTAPNRRSTARDRPDHLDHGGAAAVRGAGHTIFDRTGSAAWVALSLLLTFGVLGFVGPPAGMLGDRFDRRKVMIVSELAGAACFAMMALSDEPAWLLAWAFLSALAGRRSGRRRGRDLAMAGPERDLGQQPARREPQRGITIRPALGGRCWR